ncbi:MAG TPA: DUF6401 family natural product biosynthesis protein [Pseudonocardiaceae bacterium]|jgi:hypothetical protein|nr:DUF6401 family natural product biosynthesis protein [Pseudonocardiaceae bacterium]
MLGFISHWAELSARRMLAHLDVRIGSPGMVAAATVPGLTAAVDQHAAAVRDILTIGVDGPAAMGAVSLAGYARGLLDQARTMGWPVEAPMGWTKVNWLTTRLLAVCDLARRMDEPKTSLEPLF